MENIADVIIKASQSHTWKFVKYTYYVETNLCTLSMIIYICIICHSYGRMDIGLELDNQLIWTGSKKTCNEIIIKNILK